jgi:hypothetical protein
MNFSFEAPKSAPADLGECGHTKGLVGSFYVKSGNATSSKFDSIVSAFSQKFLGEGSVPLDRPILPPEEWIENQYYSGPFAGDFLWPEKKKMFISAAQGDVTEVILTGAIGVGKTQILVLLAMYDYYRLSCFSSPQNFLNLPSTSPLVIVMVSMKKEKAKAKLFEPLLTAIDATPYFQYEFPRNQELSSKIASKTKNIIIRPDVTSESAIHSEDVLGLYATECNFYAVVEESAKKRGETLDVAEDLVENCFRRMESRFMRNNTLQLCRVVLDSSRQYPDDFVERRERTALAGDAAYPTVVFSMSQWEAKKGVKDNAGNLIFSGRTFPVEVGSGNRASRILAADEVEHATGRVVWCAEEMRASFLKDLDGSLRDLAGVSVEGLRPLIPQRENFVRCLRLEVDGYADYQCRHPFSSQTTTLSDSVEFYLNMLVDPVTKRPRVNPNMLRAVHADPGVTSDAFGLAMGHVSNLVTVNRLTEGETTRSCGECFGAKVCSCPRCLGTGKRRVGRTEVRCASCRGQKTVVCPVCNGTGMYGTPMDRPRVYMDLVLQVLPPKSGRIQFDNIEAVLNKMRANGFMIGCVTADGHQSEQFLQHQLSRAGTVIAEHLSVDKTKDPYYCFRDAVMDIAADGKRRFSIYEYEPLLQEIFRLEDRRDKIDHPHNGSKDAADAVAGVVFNCHRFPFLLEPWDSGDMLVRTF